MEVLPTLQAGARLGLTAFGGGFTFGAAILETLCTGDALQPTATTMRKAS
jgi:hypothetical protein